MQNISYVAYEKSSIEFDKKINDYNIKKSLTLLTKTI